MTYAYRFPDEAAWLAAAAAEGLIVNIDGQERLQAYTHDHAIHVIGTIWEGGEYDPETGDVITPPVALPGWHVNVKGIAPAAWDEHLVVVHSPSEIFFGDPGPFPNEALTE